MCERFDFRQLRHNLTIYRTNCPALHDRGALATFNLQHVRFGFNFVMELVRNVGGVAKKIIFYQHPRASWAKQRRQLHRVSAAPFYFREARTKCASSAFRSCATPTIRLVAGTSGAWVDSTERNCILLVYKAA